MDEMLVLLRNAVYLSFLVYDFWLNRLCLLNVDEVC